MDERGLNSSRGTRSEPATTRLRFVGGVAAGVAAIAVVAAAYTLGQDSRQEPVREPSAASERQPPPAALAAAPGRDPVSAAEEWLRASRTITYSDPSATAWIARVQPVITGELAQQTLELRNAGGGTEWHDFVAQRCERTVREVAAIVPAEAPRDDMSAFAQVTGDVVTTCAGSTPEQTDPVAATVEVRRGPDGRWRVAKRLF